MRLPIYTAFHFPRVLLQKTLLPFPNQFRRFYASATSMGEVRKFAPLGKKDHVLAANEQILKGVVFDVDGTLCEPQTYMFGEMRAAISCPKSVDILEHIYAMSDSEQVVAMEAIRDIERRAMTSQTPQPGLLTLITYLETHKLPLGICTRNFDTPVAHLLKKFLAGSHFHPIVTRDFRPPKPHPAGILHICENWGVQAKDVLMVGDSVDDMTAGYRAGATTVLLVNDVNRHLVEHEHTDIVIERLDELVGVLEKGLQGRYLEGRGFVGSKDGSSGH